MKIVQRQKRVYELTCGNCLTKLELDDSDFSTQEIVVGTYTYLSDRVSVNCPVCGRSFKNLERINCTRKIVPIDENDEIET